MQESLPPNSKPAAESPFCKGGLPRNVLSEGEIPSDIENDGNENPGWNRFGVRHFLVWMIGIGAMGGILRAIEALRFAYDQTGSLDADYLRRFLQAWPIVRLNVDDLAGMFVYGSILGLGIPAALTKPPNTEFWRHPGRVHFALACAMTSLAIGVQLLGTGLFGSILRSEENLSLLGGFGTAFVWSFYTMIRSRTRLVWRLALFLITLSIATEFCLTAYQGVMLRQTTLPSTSIIKLEQTHVLASIGAGVLIVLALIAAGIIELMIGRYRDWRVWSMTFLMPVAYLVASSSLYYELCRAYKFGSFSMGAGSLHSNFL